MQTRRTFLRQAAALGAGGVLASSPFGAAASAQERVTLPFENGTRELIAFPQKRPLIVLTSRPGRIKLIHEVRLPRPRDVIAIRETEAYAREFSTIWHVLGEEFAKPAEESGA